MSNYHYNDQRGNSGCLGQSQYYTLEETTQYTCDQPCICRFTDERSTKDKMYYNWFVKDQPMQLPGPQRPFPQPVNSSCKNNIGGK